MKQTETLIQDGCFIRFIIEFADGDCETSVDFSVFEITGWDDEDNRPVESKPYMRGRIKWDGCSHINMGDKDGYLYFGGENGFEQHKRVIDSVWSACTKKIKKFDYDIAKH